MDKNKATISEGDQLEMQFLAMTEFPEFDKELLE